MAKPLTVKTFPLFIEPDAIARGRGEFKNELFSSKRGGEERTR
jgi:hypothetical protein